MAFIFVKTSSAIRTDPRLTLAGYLCVLDVVLLFAGALMFSNPMTEAQKICFQGLSWLLPALVGFIVGGKMVEKGISAPDVTTPSSVPRMSPQEQLPPGT